MASSPNRTREDTYLEVFRTNDSVAVDSIGLNGPARQRLQNLNRSGRLDFAKGVDGQCEIGEVHLELPG